MAWGSHSKPELLDLRKKPWQTKGLTSEMRGQQRAVTWLSLQARCHHTTPPSQGVSHSRATQEPLLFPTSHNLQLSCVFGAVWSSVPPCALMKAAPSPIFISLGSGNKVTDSDTDRWPLLASQMCIIRGVSALFYSSTAAQGTPLGTNAAAAVVKEPALIYIILHYLSSRKTIPNVFYTLCILWCVTAVVVSSGSMGLWDPPLVPYQESLAILFHSPWPLHNIGVYIITQFNL